MKEDYLWDKTGEPDPEIQELERVLGTLRYQPRPLDIPAELAPKRKSTFLPRLPRLLAIAATIAIMLLGVGLWFGLQRTQNTQVSQQGNKHVTTITGSEVAVKPSPENNPTPVVQSTAPKEKAIPRRVRPGSLSPQLMAGRGTPATTPKLTAEERKEAEAAKEQLMLALRVASSKLSFAQKKAQEVNTQNLTHNQHKAG